jgi:hypothetical protein
MSLFKKDEKLTFVNNKYILTDTEASVKQYSEQLIILQQYGLAAQELKILIEETKKKDLTTYMQFIELKIYCLLMVLNNQFNKKELKEIEALVNEAIQPFYHQDHRTSKFLNKYPRLVYCLHLVCYIKLSVGDAKALEYGT